MRVGTYIIWNFIGWNVFEQNKTKNNLRIKMQNIKLTMKVFFLRYCIMNKI